ncbi:MAG: methylamine utilization protein [Gammaproteobacteria bacterium]|nr:methylamine utilization protein [Gammaproteobacteria bacterium]
MNKFKLLKTGLFSIAVTAATSVYATEHIVDQKNKSFVENGKKIESLVMNKGDTIRFKNEDPFFHNIFSLSDNTTFDLGSFPKGDSKTVTFDKAGMIEVECAIHPEMYMEVTVK